MNQQTEASPTVVYLVGSGRSGTTLLERILGASDLASNVGELSRIFQYGVLLNEGCGCGASFDECGFWQSVGERAFGGWDRGFALHMEELRQAVLRQRSLPNLVAGRIIKAPADQRIVEYVQAYDDIYSALAELSGTKILIDASKNAIHGVFLSHLARADIRALQLVRDPRGVAHSCAKVGIDRPNAGLGNQTMRTLTAAESARMWNRTNLGGILLRASCPSATVSYEEFVSDPKSTLSAALSRAGLPVALVGVLSEPSVTLPTSHALGGNPNRFHRGPLRVRADDTWRAVMPRHDQRIVNVYTAPLRAAMTAESLRARRNGKL